MNLFGEDMVIGDFRLSEHGLILASFDDESETEDDLGMNYDTVELTNNYNTLSNILTGLLNTMTKRFVNVVDVNSELTIEDISSYCIIYTQTETAGTGVFTKIGAAIVPQGSIDESLTCECLSDTSIKFASTNENQITVVVLCL